MCSPAAPYLLAGLFVRLLVIFFFFLFLSEPFEAEVYLSADVPTI